MENKDTKEQWKPLKCFANVKGFYLYMVSNRGRVLRKGANKGKWPGRILEPRKSKNGYSIITISHDRRYECKRVDILVLETFGNERPKNYQCNHKDGDLENNNIENLEWIPLEEYKKLKVSNRYYK